jgi:hypothetical protein
LKINNPPSDRLLDAASAFPLPNFMLSNEPFSITHFKAFICLSAVFLSLSVRISFNSPGKEEKNIYPVQGSLRTCWE